MPTITLGQQTLELTAQKHAYLTRKLGPLIETIRERADKEGALADTDSVLKFVGDSVYDLLVALVPGLEKRMPRWMFLGFASKNAMAEGTYDEDADESPSLPELRTAVEAALRVNGFDDLVKLGKALGIDLFAGARERLNQSTDSVSLPPANGESVPTSSGTTGPTPDGVNGASPSLASVL